MSIASFIYPNICGFCNKILKEGYICKNCKELLKKYDYSFLVKSKYCNKVIVACKYEGMIKSKVLQFKFKGKKYLARTFSEIILNKLDEKFDLVIPVPIHSRRKFIRGYNQSELLAREIARKLGLKVKNNILIKTKNNLPQSELGQEQRTTNVKNVYEIRNANKLSGKRILLVDDIYTTGSTIGECARILKSNGATEVSAVVIAKTIMH